MKFCLAFIAIFGLIVMSACSQPSAPNLTPKLWSTPVGGFGPSVLGNDLLVGYLDGIGEQFAAVDVNTRNIVWRSEKGEAISFTQDVAIGEEAIYIFLNGKGLIVYSRTGEVLARVSPPGEDGAEGGAIGAGLVLQNDILYAPNGRHLYAYNVSEPSNPVLLWKVSFPKTLLSLTADTQGVYIGGAVFGIPSSISKLSSATGEELWTTNPEKIGDDPLTVQVLELSAGTLLAYVQGSLQAFDPKMGEHLWTVPLGDCPDGVGPASAMEIGGNMAYISPGLGSCLFAVDLVKKEAAWTVSTGEVGPDGAITIDGKPLYHNGVVYTSVERLWALDARTGRVLSFAGQRAENTTTTFVHYANGEILVWGDDLTAYKPVR